MRWTTKVLNSDYETFVLEFFAYPYMWSTACFDYYHTHIIVLLPSGVATQQYRAHMEDWLAACMHNIIRVEWWGGGDLSDRTSSSWCRLVGWAGLGALDGIVLLAGWHGSGDDDSQVALCPLITYTVRMGRSSTITLDRGLPAWIEIK